MPSRNTSDPQHWRDRAAQMRALALTTTNSEAAGLMNDLTAEYDILAGRAASPRDDTGRIQSRQNGETGTDRVTKDPVRSCEKVSSGANFIFTFSDAMG